MGTKAGSTIGLVDLSSTRTSEGGTKVHILSKNVNDGKHTIQRMSFKQMIRTPRKGHCKLYMARLLKGERGVADSSNLESANQVEVSEPFKNIIQDFSDVFRQKLPDTMPLKGHFNLR